MVKFNNLFFLFSVYKLLIIQETVFPTKLHVSIKPQKTLRLQDLNAIELRY